MLRGMTLRGWLGLVVVATYLGVLVHVTAATQCPMRQSGACARVHDLMRGVHAPAAPAMAVASPMRASLRPDVGGDDAVTRGVVLLARR
jgi:hypothetical protein